MVTREQTVQGDNTEYETEREHQDNDWVYLETWGFVRVQPYHWRLANPFFVPWRVDHITKPNTQDR